MLKIKIVHLNREDGVEAGPACRRQELVDDGLLGVVAEVLVPDDAVHQEEIDWDEDRREGHAGRLQPAAAGQPIEGVVVSQV